jgi:hypothetical protein
MKGATQAQCFSGPSPSTIRSLLHRTVDRPVFARDRTAGGGRRGRFSRSHRPIADALPTTLSGNGSSTDREFSIVSGGQARAVAVRTHALQFHAEATVTIVARRFGAVQTANQVSALSRPQTPTPSATPSHPRPTEWVRPDAS